MKRYFSHGFGFGAGVVAGGLVTFLIGIQVLEWLDRKGLRYPP